MPSSVAIWPMRSFGVILRAVQKSGAPATVFRPITRTPLWSKVQGVLPKVLFQVDPMSRYQSCSPGMKTLRTFTSFSSSAPSCSSTGSPSCARSPPKIMKSAGGFIACTSLKARTVFSTKRELSSLGYRCVSETQAKRKFWPVCP
ncbi:hypothetical protein D9M72_574540 [compost metagenome]